MDSFKKNAFFKRFPWLEKVERKGHWQDLTNISVKRIDEQLLLATPETYYHDGSMGMTDYGEEVLLVLDKGDTIVKVVSAGRSSSNYAHTPSRDWKGERIIDAFKGIMDINNRLDAITRIIWVHDDWEGGGAVTHEWEIVIYLPKVDVEAMIDHLTVQADQRLEQEIESC